MSWFAKSLSNTLKQLSSDDSDSKLTPEPDGDHCFNDSTESPDSLQQEQEQEPEREQEQDSMSRGVKEDLSELTETLTRQLRGVATFLAPPPSASNACGSAKLAGEASRISKDEAAAEASRSECGSDSDEGSEADPCDAVGITDEVLAFARNIAMHPETWIDFPLFMDDDDPDDFVMSDAQLDHAFAIENLAPRLAALRIELCPIHMSEGCFWKIYFVLLHSRLSKQDAELLLTPQVMDARALWLRELQNQSKAELDRFKTSTSYTKAPVFIDHEEQLMPSSFYKGTPAGQGNSFFTEDVETEKRPVYSTEIRTIGKSIVEEPMKITTNKDFKNDASRAVDENSEEEDDWLEDSGDLAITVAMVNEEDISFSDLEDSVDG